MPLPLFTICCHSTAEDRESGRFSIFEVVEKLVIAEVKPGQAGATVVVERQRLAVATTWMIDRKAGERFEDEFELSLEVRLENDKPLLSHTNKFRFAGPDRPAHRVTYNLNGSMPITRSGILVIESRARKVGSSKWKSQTYRIEAEFVRSQDEPG